MDGHTLYILRYKKGLAQPQTGFLIASSLQRAEAVGHAYCAGIPGCRYIHVTPAVLADETILAKEVAATSASMKAPAKREAAITA
jgi:hypothetical protein